MPEHYARVPLPHHPRRLDEPGGPYLQRHAAGHLCHPDPPEHHQKADHYEYAAAHRDGQYDEERQGGQRVHDVVGPHHRLVGEPAPVPRVGAVREAHGDRAGRDGHPDEQGKGRAPHESDGKVAAQRVRPHCPERLAADDQARGVERGWRGRAAAAAAVRPVQDGRKGVRALQDPVRAGVRKDGRLGRHAAHVEPERAALHLDVLAHRRVGREYAPRVRRRRRAARMRRQRLGRKPQHDAVRPLDAQLQQRRGRVRRGILVDKVVRKVVVAVLERDRVGRGGHAGRAGRERGGVPEDEVLGYALGGDPVDPRRHGGPRQREPPVGVVPVAQRVDGHGREGRRGQGREGREYADAGHAGARPAYLGEHAGGGRQGGAASGAHRRSSPSGQSSRTARRRRVCSPGRTP